jgi:hypothetical protein
VAACFKEPVGKPSSEEWGQPFVSFPGHLDLLDLPAEFPHSPHHEDAPSGRSQRECARTARKAISYQFVWGVIKSLTFAWVILAIACYQGLHVRGGADAVGRATTDSVVVSIFMVVVIDAIYSLILYT